MEIANLFKTIMVNSSVVKAVVASRPEPAFVEAFHTCPKLLVENLTASDIGHYVQSRLLTHSKMQAHGGSELAAKLTRSISSKACGVFLWVFLVVRSLLECLSDGSYPEDLERIIQTYPQELHELYEHMFQRMKPSHRAEAFRLFQAIHHVQNIESSIPSALRLSFFERDHPEGLIQAPLKFMGPEELQGRLSSFESRLRSRCCGLFEVQYFDKSSSGETLYFHEGRVSYLHRTVSDFLKDPGVRQVIERETCNAENEIYDRLRASILYSLKSWGFFQIRTPTDWKRFMLQIAGFLTYCRICKRASDGLTPSDYIEELDRVLIKFWQVRSLETRSKASGLALGNYEHHWAESLLDELHLKYSKQPDDEPLLSLAARYGVQEYVSQKLHSLSATKTDFLSYGGRSVVLRVSFWAMHHRHLTEQHLMIIECFLNSGFKINLKERGASTVSGRTAWQELLYLQSKTHSSQIRRMLSATGTNGDRRDTTTVESLDVWTQVIEMFLKFGASLDVSFKHSRADADTQVTTARSIILEIMATSETEGLSSSESAISQGTKTRIQRILSDQQAIEATINAISTPSYSNSSKEPSSQLSSNLGMIGEAPRLSRRRKNRRSAGYNDSQLSGSPEASIQPTILQTIIPSPNQICSRCKAVDELSEIGFQSRDILRAVQEAGVGNDVPALTAWILDHVEAAKDSVLQMKPRASELQRTRPAAGSSRSPVAKQWSTVVNKAKSSSARSSGVVGAEWVSTTLKPKGHKSKAKATNGSDNAVEDGTGDAAAGAIQVKGGTFTWFYESTGQPGCVSSLTTEQTRQLENFLRSLDL